VGTAQPVDSVRKLIEEHSESRKRIAYLKAKLEAMSVALDLAAVHVNCIVQNIDNPGWHHALRGIPTSEAVFGASMAYIDEMKRALELAADLAEFGI
jgi:hypothetical protein